MKFMCLCLLLNSSILMDRLGPMLGVYSSGSALAWNWIIEYLSSFPEIDSSIISRLVDTSPLLEEDLEKDTKERIALRCLEKLFGPRNSLGSVAPPDSRVAFRPSRSCDDVLEEIMREVPGSNVRNAGLELSRWDGHSFIDHKRATLPKCALEKLKDSILVDIPVGGDENGPPPRSDGGDDEKSTQEGNLIPPIPKNEKSNQEGNLIPPIPQNEKSNQEGNLIPPIPKNDDLSTCAKCNKNGQVLLVCGSCPLVVHESCLNCTARFDDEGKFLCPSCAYSVSISKYNEAKDKITLARKKMVIFMELMGKLHEQKSGPPHHSLNGDEHLAGIRESGPPHHSTLNGDEHLAGVRESGPPTELKSFADNHATKDTVGEESSPRVEDKFIISSYTTRSGKHEAQFSFPPTFESRRKTDPWTNDEEEMLRKGVQEFTNGDGTVLWKRILEFGNEVFLRDRTATDLKNKWRSMCKGKSQII